MANLPEQVQRQVAEAEATLAAMQQEVTPADGTVVQPVQGVEPTPSNVTSVQPTTTPDDQNSETYAQRWRSLQGVYNATVRQKDGLAGRVAQLEHILSTLQQPPSQPAQNTQPNTRYVTEKDVTDYGDSLETMRRVAREELAPVFAQLQNTINSVGQNVSNQVQHVAQRQALTQEEIFYQKLRQVVPEWEQINADANFQQWLSGVDPQTGIQRQIYISDAHQRLDVNRVAHFFHAWVAQQQQAAQAQQVATTSPQTVTRSPATQLELQVSPGHSRAVAPPAGSGTPKVWARSAITKFYDDVRKQYYRGKDAEREQIERDIFAASREGRVVVG